MNTNAIATRQITRAGYSLEAARAGIAWAKAQIEAGADDSLFSLAMTRILFTDSQIADGVRFS